jgi:hypothetical protein
MGGPSCHSLHPPNGNWSLINIGVEIVAHVNIRTRYHVHDIPADDDPMGFDCFRDLIGGQCVGIMCYCICHLDQRYYSPSHSILRVGAIVGSYPIRYPPAVLSWGCSVTSVHSRTNWSKMQGTQCIPRFLPKFSVRFATFSPAYIKAPMLLSCSDCVFPSYQIFRPHSVANLAIHPMPRLTPLPLAVAPFFNKSRNQASS